jgi:GNAT superfamily N-acetyltransferase
MQTHAKLTIRRVPWSNCVGRDLRAAQQAERGAAPDPTDADLAVFLIAYERATGQPLGCGGLRWLEPTIAEARPIYVLPYARGAGIAASILTALEGEAHAASVTTVVAEAGTARPGGEPFFEAAGYRRIPNFGPYQESEGSVCLAKPVTDPVRVHAASI